MMRKLWNVPVSTLHVSFHIVVLGITSNDARINAIEFVNSMYGLDPARWECGECENWVRTYCTRDNPYIEEPYFDGFKCSIGKPSLIGE